MRRDLAIAPPPPPPGTAPDRALRWRGGTRPRAPSAGERCPTNYRGAESGGHDRHRRADVQLRRATSLRSWFDYVLRAGETFLFGRGNERSARASGDRDRESRRALQRRAGGALIPEQYLRHLLGFMHQDVTFVHARRSATTRSAGGRRRAGQVGIASLPPCRWRAA